MAILLNLVKYPTLHLSPIVKLTFNDDVKLCISRADSVLDDNPVHAAIVLLYPCEREGGVVVAGVDAYPASPLVEGQPVVEPRHPGWLTTHVVHRQEERTSGLHHLDARVTTVVEDTRRH